MLQTVIISFLGIISLADVILTIYFYRKKESDKKNLNQLLTNGVKVNAKVISKQCKNSFESNNKNLSKTLTIQYEVKNCNSAEAAAYHNSIEKEKVDKDDISSNKKYEHKYIVQTF